MRRLVLLSLLVLGITAGAAQARGDDHGGRGGGEVRVAGTCGRDVTTSLRLRARDHGIQIRFRLRESRGRGVWRIAFVHERRIAARATRRTTRLDDYFELRRTLPDLPGSDTVVVHTWGPRGLGCRASATLRE